jgi:CBS domain containing-hemolysin-like protein
MDKCGCIPRPGEIIEDEGIEIKVIGTSEKTIDLVRIRRIDDGDSEGD